MAKDLLLMLSAVAEARSIADTASFHAATATRSFVAEAVRQGVPKAQVGRWLGISRQAVQQWCK